MAGIAAGAAIPARPAVLNVVLEVGIDGIAESLMGRDGALVDVERYEGVRCRAGAVADCDLLPFIPGRRLALALALAMLPALGHRLA